MEWRETSDPYRIWVSEIMLQQTRVETVAPYYTRFISRFPDIASLAGARQDDVLSMWEGLGYYARARNLHRCARIVRDRHGGALPSTVGELMGLPGVGRSTAGAIAAIAFGRDEPILDANARRVVARLFGVRGDLRAAAVERTLWELSGRLVRKGTGRDTALAVMDLGAVVCLPGSPRCPECPVSGCCESFGHGLQGEIPPRRSRKAVPRHDIVAALFRRDGGRYYVRRRPAEGLLGGLWAFPSGRRMPGESPEGALRRAVREKLGAEIEIQRDMGSVEHAYSHYRITLHGFLCSAEGSGLPSDGDSAWIRPGGSPGRAIPRADRKLLERIREEEGTYGP
jgi:A/G-specific adenine glycosylase